MRLSVLTAALSGCVFLAGCASSTSPETVLAIKPSVETTRSVSKRGGPVPEVAVGESPVKADDAQEILAWAGPVPETRVFETMTQQTAIPLERPAGEQSSEGRSRKRSRIYSQQFRGTGRWPARRAA